MATLKPHSNGPYSNTVIGTLQAVDGGLLHLVQRGGAWVGCGPAHPLLAVPNVTAHPSTTSIPTSYYLMWRYCYLCNLHSKWLIWFIIIIIIIIIIKQNRTEDGWMYVIISQQKLESDCSNAGKYEKAYVIELTTSSCWLNEIIVCSYKSSRVAACMQQILLDIHCSLPHIGYVHRALRFLCTHNKWSHDKPELVMGWVHPSVGLGWVGSEFFLIFGGLGWVEWRLDCVIFLTSWNTPLSANEYCSWIITVIDCELVCDV